MGGRAVSARRLKSVGPLLAPGTSMVLAWAGEPVTQDILDPASRLGHNGSSCASTPSKTAPFSRPPAISDQIIDHERIERAHSQWS